MSLVSQFERTNNERLARLQKAGAKRHLITEMLETSCLLELARLGTARLDLLSYLQAAADVITQMFPVAGVTIEAHPAAMRAGKVSSGEPIESTALAERHRIVLDDETIGALLVGRLSADVKSTGFFRAACDVLAAGIAVVVETESLRRSAAAASAMHAAAKVAVDNVENELGALATALANWPGAIASDLYVDHQAIGSPIHVRAGFWDVDGVERPVMERAIPGAYLRVRWASDDDEGTAEQFDEVVRVLMESFASLTADQRLRNEVETDPLTGLGNRRRLEYSLEGSLLRARRFGERLALVMCDLDHFKKVNDTLGHHVGDEVLRIASEVLRSTVRGYDIVCRMGGEEFVVVCPRTDQVAALTLAERIRAELPVRASASLPAGWRQTVSIGVAIFPDHGDGNGLMNAADVALYRAKSGGRDKVVMAVVEEVSESGAASVSASPLEPSPETDTTAPDAGARRRRGLGRILGR